ncbi:hypothetical protein F0562_028052 [Nyssa sinensis]|uniref:Polyglutamine-binding protein 1 n=1 Tax=Nyssa sinensis TaxID=561372 RepID=A0A5J5B903_9ASTE|nr:hypothetical protein F0562_028052 [Nyssa sinensis]
MSALTVRTDSGFQSFLSDSVSISYLRPEKSTRFDGDSAELMDNNCDQPLPPGVQSLPNSSLAASWNSSTQYPPQSFQNSVKPHHHAHYSENNLFPVPSSTAALTPPFQSFYPHIRPSAQFNYAPYAPNLSDQIPNNFQNSHLIQPRMPTSQTFRQDTSGSVISTGIMHGIMQSHVEYDGSQPRPESLQGGGHQRFPQLDESNVLTKQADKADSNGQQEVMIGEANHRSQSGEQKCSEAFGANQDGLSSTIQHGANLLEQQSRKLNELDGSDSSASYSRLHLGSANDIETAAQDAVLREQEITTQKIIHSQRQARGASGGSEDNTDIFSGRHDPNALKEHLLKITTEHRAEMALKRDKSTFPKEGNMEIGNGYGVPGGGAYYGASRPNIVIPSQKNPELDRESEQKPVAKELPEYLKRKLRERGILKDDSAKKDPALSDNKSETQSPQTMALEKLPPGWIETKDPASGALYYYNESSGKSQWERPVEAAVNSEPTSRLPLPKDWLEAFDEATGQKYFYNTKTHISQWVHPDSSQQVASHHYDSMVSSNAANGNWGDQSSVPKKCMRCSGWGVGLVQLWGYCNHCTRVLNLPQSQYLSASFESQQQTTNAASTKEDSNKRFPKQRYL